MNRLLILDSAASVYDQPDLIKALESIKIGGSFPDQVAEIFCGTCQRFISGVPLAHVVDFKRGY